MSRAQSYIYQILSRPPNTKIAGPTTHSTFHTWLSKKIGPRKWPAKKREGRKKMTLMILKFLTWESGESKNFNFPAKSQSSYCGHFLARKLNYRISNWLEIGKLIHFFAKNPNYSFEFLRQKWSKYHCWFLALKLKHLKWVCLTFNERILRFCQNKTSHESAILQFCAKKSFSATASTGGDYVQKCSQKLHKEYYKW